MANLEFFNEKFQFGDRKNVLLFPKIRCFRIRYFRKKALSTINSLLQMLVGTTLVASVVPKLKALPQILSSGNPAAGKVPGVTGWA